uniref:ATP synthase F0 subunit 8 n=1 Tax=Glycera unicornis TaxID=529288 RepID=A0A0U2VS55_9ANNE|nr:ATP synthase F0 subunit 8 [Glycera unicornis]
MPHLAPMSWILTPLTFLLLLILFISSSWWHQSFFFPKMNIRPNNLQSKWNWS